LRCSGLTPIDTGLNYNPVDAFNGRAGTVGSFGFGWVSDYDIAFLPFDGPQKRIILPGSRFVNFVDDGSGIYRNVDDPRFDGATIHLVDATLNQWELKFKDGRIWRFLPFAGITGKIRGGPPTFVTEMIDAAANVLNISRQSNGRIVSIGSPERNVVMSYGGNGFVSDLKDTVNRTMHFTYTSTNRLATVTDADNKVMSYTYVDDTEIALDPACSPQPTMGERIKTISYPGRPDPTTNFYGPGRRVLRQIGYDGREYKFAYKLTGACVTQVSNPGVKCTANCPDSDSWDNFQAGWRIHGGRVIATTVTKPDGNQYTQSFNARGVALSLVDTQGQQTQYKYDAGNRPVQITDVLGRAWAMQYDEKGNLQQRVDPSGGIVSYSYDGKWNKVTNLTRFLPDNTAVVWQFAYDPNTGRRISATDPLGNVTSYTYTPRGQLATVTVPGNRTSTFVYNAAGDLISATDPLGNERRFGADGAGRTTSATDALGFTTTTELNGVSAVTKITDPLVQDTRMTYDAAGRPVAVINPLNNTVESYQYDAGDHLTQKTDALLKSTLYSYNSGGRLASVTDRKGQLTSFTYDAQKRLTAITYPDTGTQTRTYDAVGRLVEIREAGTAISYTYDNVSRVVLVATDNATGHNEVGYDYDTLSRVVRRTVNGGDPTTYTYDNASRPITITYRNQVTTYAWDNSNRLTSKILPDGIVQSFTYDDADRVTLMEYRKPDNTLIDSIAYGYDANGRRIAKTTTGGSSIQETGISATYDAANRMTSLALTAINRTFSLAYDDNGNLASKTDQANPSNTTTYTWDSRNRLTGINAPGIIATFQYDVLGRRSSKTVNGQTIGYVYEGAQAIGEVTGGTISATILTTLAIDDVVARYTQAGARTYLTDALGSVLALVKDDQSIQAFYAYTPYGESQVLGDDEGNAVQYTARENDQTGLYYYRARYYDPVLKRFIAEDPIGLAGGSNMYSYVRGNPMIFVDPLGLVNAVRGGVVLRAGYQVPGNPDAGLGWRVTIVAPDGTYDQYGHMDPDTTPYAGTPIEPGQDIGDYGDPTNGNSTGPHVHHERRDRDGNIIDPGTDSPIPGGRLTSGFGDEDRSHPGGHQGNDWVDPNGQQRDTSPLTQPCR